MIPSVTGASVLLTDAKFTKDHVERHVGKSIPQHMFEKTRTILASYRLMEAKGTAQFLRLPDTRPSVYGCNKVSVNNLKEWNETLDAAARDIRTRKTMSDFVLDRLGPVYEIMQATGLCQDNKNKNKNKKRGTTGGSARKEGKKTRALQHSSYTFDEKIYSKNKHRLYNNNQAAATSASSLATSATQSTPEKGKRKRIGSAAVPSSSKKQKTGMVKKEAREDPTDQVQRNVSALMIQRVWKERLVNNFVSSFFNQRNDAALMIQRMYKKRLVKNFVSNIFN